MATTYINSYNFAAQKIILSSTPGPASNITTYGDYIVFEFIASATLNVGVGAPGTADVFIVGGGSTGGTSGNSLPGGTGGTGGKALDAPGVTITAGTPISVTVGGAASPSSFGPNNSSSGSNGGSGGAGATYPTPTPGSPGSTGHTNTYLTGSSQTYAGGGGGGAGSDFPGLPVGGSGGATGGGPGGGTRVCTAVVPSPKGIPIPISAVVGNAGNAGTVNTGGGGGGAAGGGQNGVCTPNPAGGVGGSGIVIARFPTAQFTT